MPEEANKQQVAMAKALCAAQAEMPMVGKRGVNTYDKYSYAKLDDYVRVVRPIFSKHKLSMLTSVDGVESLPPRKTSSGKEEFVVRVNLTVTILHEEGGFLQFRGWGEGQDRGDKAIYKAITGARKYAIASALGLATSDDPEECEPTAQPLSEAAPQRPVPEREPDGEPVSPGEMPAPAPAAPQPAQPKVRKPTLRKRLIDEIAAWAEAKPEDMPDAIRYVKSKCGVTAEKATEEELAKMYQWVLDQRKAGVDFAEAIS